MAESPILHESELARPFVEEETLEMMSHDIGMFSPRVPKCLSTIRHETKVTEQYLKALKDIKQCVSRYEAHASRQATVILPQATEIAKFFITIDKILFKKLRSPDSDDYIDVVALLEVIGRLFNQLPTIKVETQGCDELIAVVLQTIGLVGAFVPTSFRNLMPLQVAGGLASLPLTSHRLCLDNLCMNTLPLCLIHVPNRHEAYQSEEPGTCAAGVLGYVLQYCPGNTVHARVLETIMALKEGVCMDLLKLIAHSATPLRQNAVRLLFHFFPQVQLSGAYHTRFKSVSWSHPLCQYRDCQSSGERKTASKMCMNAICASTTGGHYPPLYLCDACCNKVHGVDSRDHLIVSLVQPSSAVGAFCEDETCVGPQVAHVTCYDHRCTEGGRPRRLCPLCEKRNHWMAHANHFPVQRTVPFLASCFDSADGPILVEAIVSLLCEVSNEASALRVGNNRNTRARFRRATGILDRTAELDPTKDTRLLSQFGLVLLSSYCPVEKGVEDDLAGRLAAALLLWVDCVARFDHGIIFSNLDPFRIKYANPWITSFYKEHFNLLIRCLRPDPPEFCRVGRFWSTISARADQYKLGLQRLHSLLSSNILGFDAVFAIWNAVMPMWMKALACHVDRKELKDFETTLSSLFSLVIFLEPKLYDKFLFLKKGFQDGSVWEQIDHLQFYQVLLQVRIPVPKIETCFFDLLSADCRVSEPAHAVTATAGESTCALSTTADDGGRLVASADDGGGRLVASTPSRDTLSPLHHGKPPGVAQPAAPFSPQDEGHVSRAAGPRKPNGAAHKRTSSFHPTLVIDAEHDGEAPPEKTPTATSPAPGLLNQKSKVEIRHSLPSRADVLFHSATAPNSPIGSMRRQKMSTPAARRGTLRSATSPSRSWSRHTLKGVLSSALGVGTGATSPLMCSPVEASDEASDDHQRGMFANSHTPEVEHDVNANPFPVRVPDSCASLLRLVFVLDALVVLTADPRMKELPEAKIDHAVVQQLLTLMLQLDWGDHDAIFKQQAKAEPHSMRNCVHCRLQAWWFDLAKKLLLHFFPRKNTLKWKESNTMHILEAVRKGMQGKPNSEPESPTTSLSDDDAHPSKQKEKQSGGSSFNAAVLVSRFVHIAKRNRDSAAQNNAQNNNNNTSCSSSTNNSGNVQASLALCSPRESPTSQHRSTSFSNAVQNRRTSDGTAIATAITAAREMSDRRKRTHSLSHRAGSDVNKAHNRSASQKKKTIPVQRSSDSLLSAVAKDTTPSRKSAGGDDGLANGGGFGSTTSSSSTVSRLAMLKGARNGDDLLASRSQGAETPGNGKRAWDILRGLRGSPKLSQLSGDEASTTVAPSQKRRSGNPLSTGHGDASPQPQTTPRASGQSQQRPATRPTSQNSPTDTSHLFSVVEVLKPTRRLSMGMSTSLTDVPSTPQTKHAPPLRCAASLTIPGIVDPPLGNSFTTHPLIVQLFLGVIQKLVEVRNGNAGPHHGVLTCLRILLQNANCLQLVKILCEPLQSRLINKTLVPRLWELMTVADSSNANAVYVVLIACMESTAGPLALGHEVRRQLGHRDWQNRFQAVEQAVTLHYSSQATRNIPDVNPALVNVMALMFTLLMDKLQDQSHHVSIQAMLFVENLPVASLKMMVQSAEKHFYDVPQDRLLVLRALDLLLSFLPGTAAVGEGIFCRMFQSLQLEVNPEEDVAAPIMQVFASSSFIGDPSDALDFDLMESCRYSRCSTGSNMSVKRGSLGFDATMADPRAPVSHSKTKFRVGSSYACLTACAPVKVLAHASSTFVSYVEQTFPAPATEEAVAAEHAARRDSASSSAGASTGTGRKPPRLVTINTDDREPDAVLVLHMLMSVFMKYLSSHAPASAFSTKRPTERMDTTRLIVSLLKAQMGCKIRSSITVFTRSPGGIRSQPVFNVYLTNIAMVLDLNMDWGHHLLQFTLSLLRFSAAPNLEEGLSFSGPHYGLENLDSASQLAWLHTALVILYKYPYRATDVHDLIKIILLTLDFRPHDKCQPPRRPSTASVFSSAGAVKAVGTRGSSSESTCNTLLPSLPDSDILSAIGEVEGESESDLSKDTSEAAFPTLVALRSQTSCDDILSITKVKPATSLITSYSSLSDPSQCVDAARGSPGLSPCQSRDSANGKAKAIPAANLDSVSHSKASSNTSAWAMSTVIPSATETTSVSDTPRPSSSYAETSLSTGRQAAAAPAAAGTNAPSLGTTMAVGHLVSRLRNFHNDAGKSEPTSVPHQGNYQEPDLAAFHDTPLLTNLPSPNDAVHRCPNCGQILPEFSDQITALAIISLEPLVQRFPNMAAPMLMEMLHSVSRLALALIDSGSTGTLLPSSQAVARQFLRTVLSQFVNNQLFLQVFKADLKRSALLKAIVASLPEPSQVPSVYKGLTLLSPIAHLLEDTSRQVNGLAMMTIISNLADYMQALPNISAKYYSTLLPLFDQFFRRLPGIFDSVSMFKRQFIVPLRIMAMLLRNVDHHFRTLLPGFSIVLVYLLRQPHQMIPLGALLTVCFRAFLNFSNSKDKERLPRCVAAELVLAWRGKSLPHRSTFLNLIKFAAIDSGANIHGIIGFDGKELPSSSLPRNLRVRQHVLQSLDVAVHFLQSTYASTTLYQDLETSAKIKVATAQLVGLEVTGYQNRAQMERLLPWLHNSGAIFGLVTELQIIQRFRLFSWLFVAAMASDNNDDNSLCQPFLDDWTNVSVCIATLCSEFLRSFQEKIVAGKDRRIQILPMMFMTCMLWTIYLEQQCIADQAVNDFWSQVMGDIIQLLNFKSRVYESVITTPFLEMIEGFSNAESSSLHKIWPIWLPLLRCSSTKFILPHHLGTISKLRSPVPDARIAVPRRTILLQWLASIQIKITGHEQAWEKNLFTQLRSRTNAARR